MSDKVYRWREGYERSLPANVAGPVIDQLREQNGGICPPEKLIEASEPDDAPCHGEFTWDNEVAGHKYRLEEARNLIRGYYEVREVNGETIQMIANVSVAGTTGTAGYMSTEEALAREDTRLQVLRDARSALNGWTMRFQHFTAAAVHIQRAIETLDAEIARQTESPKETAKAQKGTAKAVHPRKRAKVPPAPQATRIERILVT